jgi:hypothetical protein
MLRHDALPYPLMVGTVTLRFNCTKDSLGGYLGVGSIEMRKVLLRLICDLICASHLYCGDL